MKAKTFLEEYDRLRVEYETTKQTLEMYIQKYTRYKSAGDSELTSFVEGVRVLLALEDEGDE